MPDIRIVKLVLGPVSTNCYLAANRETNECVVIDPADEAGRIFAECEKHKFKPKSVLLTHGHFDHTSAAEEVRDRFRVPVYASLTESKLLSDPELNGSQLFIRQDISLAADQGLSDGELIKSAGITIKVILTPGHTSGSVCYLIQDENILFSGDTLFKDGIGRTDLPGGSMQNLVYSITNTLFSLSDEVRVFPGHGDETNIGYEKRHNIIREVY